MPPKRDGAPAAKKAKTAAKPRAKRPAKLESFAALPLDILADICALFDGSTLLALSRTTKSLRAFLYAGSSIVIWKRARIAAGLPDLECGLDEISYATLVWGRHCQLCGKKGISKTDFNSRSRVCPACAGAAVKPAIYVLEPVLHPNAFECVPSTRRFFRNSFEYRELFVPLFRTINNKLNELQALGQPQVDAYRVVMVEQKRKREQDGAALQNWLRISKIELETVKRESRDVRRHELERRFRELADWDDADFSREWREQPYVKDLKPLTERIWNNARPVLEAWLISSRAARLLIARKQVVRNRINAIDVFRCGLQRDHDAAQTGVRVPKFEIFVQLERIKPLWKGDDTVQDMIDLTKSNTEAINQEIIEHNRRTKVDMYQRCLQNDKVMEGELERMMELPGIVEDRARRGRCVLEGDAEGMAREKELETTAKAARDAPKLEVVAVDVVKVARAKKVVQELSDDDYDDLDSDDSDGDPADDAPPDVTDHSAVPPLTTPPTDIEMDELLSRRTSLFRCTPNPDHNYVCGRGRTYTEILATGHTCYTISLTTLIGECVTPTTFTPKSISEGLYVPNPSVYLAHATCVEAMEELGEGSLEEKIKMTEIRKLTCVDCAVSRRYLNDFTYDEFIAHANNLPGCRDPQFPYHAILKPIVELVVEPVALVG